MRCLAQRICCTSRLDQRHPWKPDVAFPNVAFFDWPLEAKVSFSLNSVPLGFWTTTVYVPAAGAVTVIEEFIPRLISPGDRDYILRLSRDSWHRNRYNEHRKK